MDVSESRGPEGAPSRSASSADVRAPGIRRKILRNRRLLLEVVIVFVGVWAALAAESWRDRREQARRTERIVAAIQTDARDLTTWYAAWRDTVTRDFGAWQNDRASGKLVVPFYVRWVGAERGALIGWQVALASDALDVLDPELLWDLGRVSRELDGVGERLARYMSLTEVVILPQLPRGPEIFYDMPSKTLKPEYAAHVQLFEEVLSELDLKFQMLADMDRRIGENLERRR